jgi:hypothetical protein
MKLTDNATHCFDATLLCFHAHADPEFVGERSPEWTRKFRRET